MKWLLVNPDNGLASIEPTLDKPVAADGQRVVEVLLGYPATVAWSQADGGFVDKVVAAPMISIGRFKLLFTQSERIAMRAAAVQDAHAEDFLDLLAGFTDGVSPSDPAIIVAIGQLEAGGLLAPGRAATILAGQMPS